MLETASPMDRELPRFSVGKTDLPSIDFWDVGSEHYLLVKVELTGKRNDKEMMPDGEKVRADFRILKVKPLSKEPVNLESVERQDFEETLAKAKSSKG